MIIEGASQKHQPPEVKVFSETPPEDLGFENPTERKVQEIIQSLEYARKIELTDLYCAIQRARLLGHSSAELMEEQIRNLDEIAAIRLGRSASRIIQEHYFPKNPEHTLELINYHQIDEIDLANMSNVMHVVSEGELLIGDDLGHIYFLRKQEDGKWMRFDEDINVTTIRDLQYLPNDDIFFSTDHNSYRSTKVKVGYWKGKRENIRMQEVDLAKMLPDGRLIYSANRQLCSIDKVDPSAKPVQIDESTEKISGLHVANCHWLTVEYETYRKLFEYNYDESRWVEAHKNNINQPTYSDLPQITCAQSLTERSGCMFGYDNGEIKKWITSDDENWKPLDNNDQHILIGKHDGEVTDLQILPSGTLFTVGTDNKIKIWDGEEE